MSAYFPATGKPGTGSAGKEPPLNTATVRPAQVSPAKRFVPHYVGEPVAGYTHGLQNPDRSWAKPGGKAMPGATLAERPYYTDAFTTKYHAGPAGDPSTQWNAAQIAAAKGIQAANYGTPGTILRSLLPGGLDEGGSKSAGEAVKMGADVASLLVPSGTGIKVAGLFGLGLKGLKGIKGAEDVAEAVPKAAHATEEGAAVRAAMPGMKTTRKAQAAGYKPVRGSREAAIQAIYSNPSLSVAEREHRANAALRGALPKVYFDGFKDLTPDTLERMKELVMEHPTLRGYDKKTVTKALDNAYRGETPTDSELDKIQTVFGKDTRDSLAKYGAEISKWKDAFYEVGNIPRSLMSSVDLSAVLRQGLGAVVNHPIITARNLPGMLRASKSEEFYQARVAARAARPNAPKYEIGRLAVTDLENIGKREEQFASNLAEKLTGLGKRERSPVRWSGRAYTDFLAETRADIYDHYDALFARAGRDVHDPKFIKGLSTMINSITGRGFALGPLARGEAGKVLNTVFFSPNLMASRFDLLNPWYYGKMPRELRLLALRHNLATVGAIASTLELARLAGLHVGLDPRSADFAKIKVGNTRYDLAGGYQQTVRMLWQVAVGQSKSSKTGEVVNLRSGKYGQKTVTDVLTNFFENKESPLAGTFSDFVLRGGRNTIGQKMTPGRLAQENLTPMLWGDLKDIYNEKHGGVNGVAWALGVAPLSALGVGVQTYPPQAPSKATPGGGSTSYFGGSGGGGGSYFGDSSGGGSSYFGP